MAQLRADSPLIPGTTYHWVMVLVQAAPETVQRGGGFPALRRWGTHVADPGQTVQSLQDHIQRLLCAEIEIHPSFTTVGEFRLTSD